MRLPFIHQAPTVLVCGLLLLSVAVDAMSAIATQSVGQRREAVLTWSQARRDADFRRMRTIFPSTLVAKGDRTHALPPGTPLELADGKNTAAWIAAYMHRYHLAGVMVVQDGHLRLARYAPGFGPGQRWTSFSLAKSVTSILLGAALAQGYIHSLHDPLVRYIPELKGTAYADVTVRELLTMTTGVGWDENYTAPHSDVARMYLGPCVDHRAQALEYLIHKPRKWSAGTHWNYNTGEIDLLGTLVQRATHRSLAAYLSQTIWKPYGMAADGWWIKDGCDPSENTGGSGLSATLGDYARLGEFMLGGARIDGKQVVAADWFKGATRREAATDTPGRGYGYLWWIDPDGGYAAIGIFGQLIYADPARRLIIVQVGAWPAADTDALVAARRKFVATVEQAVDAHPAAGSHADGSRPRGGARLRSGASTSHP